MNNLIEQYLCRLNLQGATFSRIEHEDAMIAIVNKIVPAGGTPVILKYVRAPRTIGANYIF